MAMPTPAITGSYLDRMNESIVLSERSRVRVTELGKEIGDIAKAELIELYRQKKADPPSEAMLATVADTAIGNDARWRLAVADEQWGQRLALMYSLAEVVLTTRQSTRILEGTYEKLEESVALAKTMIMAIRDHEDLLKTQVVEQRRLLAEQRTTNELLKMLVGQLSGPINRSNPPAPPQRVGD